MTVNGASYFIYAKGSIGSADCLASSPRRTLSRSLRTIARRSLIFSP